LLIPSRSYTKYNFCLQTAFRPTEQRDRPARDDMVVGFTTTYANGACHY